MGDQPSDATASRADKNSQKTKTKSIVKTSKKFQGHCKGDLAGITITEGGGLQEFSDFKDHLQTVGGSKYHAKIGVSIQKLTTLTMVDFAQSIDGVSKDMYTTTDSNGNDIINQTLKKSLEDMYQETVKEAAKDFNKYKNDLMKVYNVALGQIDLGTKECLKSHKQWEQIDKDRDVIGLLKVVKELCYQGNKTKVHPPTNILRALRKLVCSRQRTENYSEYVKSTVEAYEVLKSLNGSFLCKGLIEHELTVNTGKYGIKSYSEYNSLKGTDKTAFDKAIVDSFLATIIVEGSDEDTSTLKKTLSEQYCLGQDQYPRNTTRALEMLAEFKDTSKAFKSGNGRKGKDKRKGTDRSAGSGQGEKSPTSNTQDGTVFNSKGQESSGHQALMRAVANDEDFGDNDFCNFFMWGESTAQLHAIVGNIDNDSTDGSCSSDGSDIYTSDTDDDWEYWAEHDKSCSRDADSSSGAVDEEVLAETRDEDVEPTDTTEISLTVWASVAQSHAERIDSLDLAVTAAQADRFITTTNQIPATYKYSRNAFALAHQHSGKVNPNWILLDSESSINVIVNPSMVNNIREAPDGHYMNIHCNAGVARTNKIADLPGFGVVWFYEKGIANILSLALVSDLYRVTLDTAVDNALYVHKDDGTTRRFQRSSCNLYYTDMKENSSALFAINTVEGNQENFSDLDCRRADKARSLQINAGLPSTRDLLKVIDNKLWNNCGVTRRDVTIANKIYGPNPSVVKGKSVRVQQEHVREDLVPVPPKISNEYRDNVTLHVDIFTVNGVRFLHTISRHINFRTVSAISNAEQSTLVKCLKAVIGQYRSRGFQVRQIHGDNQFDCISEDMICLIPHPVKVHCVPSGQHEPTIERSIRTVKDNCRSLFSHIPFRKLPKRCIMELVYTAVFWLNSRTTGVSKTSSAREVLTGVPLDANRDARYQFLEPILAHESDTDNTMKPRAIECLYLRPTGNSHGGFFAYNLETGQRIHRRRATAIPLTKAITDRVADIAAKQGVPSGITFGDAEGSVTIHDYDESSNRDDDDASDSDYSESADDDDTVLSGVVDNVPGDMNPDETSDNGSVNGANDVTADHTGDATDNADPGTNADHDSADADDTQDEGEPGHDEGNPPADTTVNDSDGTGRRAGLRPTVYRTHNKFGVADGFQSSTHVRSAFTHGYYRAAAKIESDYNAVCLATTSLQAYGNLDASQVTQQYGVKRGIKLFGDAGVEAVLKELKQFHDMKVGEVVDPKTMNKDMIRQALPYLMFLKRKRCGKIKGRGCADGRKQRDFIAKEDAFSPTVSLHALMLSCMQDAIEGRDVATADIPGAFLQTEMPEGEDVYIRMDGTMAELLCKVDPKTYRPFLKVGKDGKKVLFTKAKKAIYGTLRAALLFWENLSGKLASWGFKMNPYDSCTMNKIINGRQCTIVWHVDDLKISHVDSKVVDSILKQLDQEYGKISPLTVKRGKVHEYVGMTIDYSESGKVKFSMFDYLEDIIQNLPDDLVGSAVTPASDHLFQVNPECEKLNTSQADRFHHYVAKLLFASKRARPDLQTAVSFLCTRVQSPDLDDWKKLKRVMGYLSETVFLPLVLGSDSSGNAYWHVDAAFAVHENMRSHTGGCLTFGNGVVIGNSSKQKLNTTSSTEAEVVGVHDNMPFICWVRYFLQAQQQHMTDNAPKDVGPSSELYKDTILYQDNTSAIRLERNGKASSTKRTRHINIRYFFITDRVKQGEVTIEYCPTDEMVADYFTKPLQGAKFRKFRNTVLGLSDADYLRHRHEYTEAKKARQSAHDGTATVG